MDEKDRKGEDQEKVGKRKKLEKRWSL